MSVNSKVIHTEANTGAAEVVQPEVNTGAAEVVQPEVNTGAAADTRTAASAGAAIEIRHLCKKYGKKTIFEELSLKAYEGSCVGILGENGCGKSTFLAALSGTLPGVRGEFLYQGSDLFKERKLRERLVGYVPQGTPLLEELTALDNLRLWYPGRRELKAELTDGVLAMLGIGDFLKVPVRKMSGGMKKRLAIGCAMASHPRILLLDEPSAALDLICKERIINYLEAFKAGGGIIFLTTHDIQELPVCDRLFILKDQKLAPYIYDGNYHRLVGSL